MITAMVHYLRCSCLLCTIVRSDGNQRLSLFHTTNVVTTSAAILCSLKPRVFRLNMFFYSLFAYSSVNYAVM